MKYYRADDIAEIFSDESRPYNWMGTETEIQEQVDFDFYKSQIESLPTIDIVTCKDCRFSEERIHGRYRCHMLDEDWDITFPVNHYCSDGERIDNE